MENKTMTDDGYTTIRIKSNDLEWLRARAASNHRSVPQEISAIREVLDIAIPAIEFTGKDDEIGKAFPSDQESHDYKER
jgi:hypothetical protein